MKPTTRRLIILDVLIVITCLLQVNIHIHPKLFVPCLVCFGVLIVYGLWLLARKWSEDRTEF